MRDEWYVARRGQDGNKRYGPVPLRELRDMMDSGKVRGEDLVWREGMAEWQRADQCAHLTPPTPPRPEPIPRDYPRDDRGLAYDDRPELRPYIRRRSSGTMVALIVGGSVLLVGFLACGGGFLYWMLNRGSAVKSAGTTPYVTTEALGESLSFGLGHLYYTANVSETDAQIVGDYLYKTGYFSSDHSALVQMDRDSGVYVVRFCVQSNKMWDSNVYKGFQDMRASLANSVLALPTRIELCDEGMQTIRTINAYD